MRRRPYLWLGLLLPFLLAVGIRAQGLPNPQALLLGVNVLRAAEGLPPYAALPELDVAAEEYALWLATTPTRAPDNGPAVGGSTFVGDINGVCLARGYADAAAVVGAWREIWPASFLLFLAGTADAGVGVADGANGRVWVLLVAHFEPTPPPPPPPVTEPTLDRLEPAEGGGGTVVTFHGEGFRGSAYAIWSTERGLVRTGATREGTALVRATAPADVVTGPVFLRFLDGTRNERTESLPFTLLPPPLPPPPPPVDAERAAALEVIRLTNAERTPRGLVALVEHPALTAAALAHSRDMAANGYFSHTSLDGRSPFQRMVEHGYTGFFTAGENIARGFTSPASVVAAWMNSAGHRANILTSSFREIGVGVARVPGGPLHWTQDFGAR